MSLLLLFASNIRDFAGYPLYQQEASQPLCHQFGDCQRRGQISFGNVYFFRQGMGGRRSREDKGFL